MMGISGVFSYSDRGRVGRGRPRPSLRSEHDLSVLVLRLVEGLLLVARGVLLVLGLPLVVRHAVDDLARLGIGDLDALLARLFAVPARQAVAAEAGQIHHVDILHVGALLQMSNQAAES